LAVLFYLRPKRRIVFTTVVRVRYSFIHVICVTDYCLFGRTVPADQSAAGWSEESCWEWRRPCRGGDVSPARPEMLQAHKKWEHEHNRLCSRSCVCR